MTTLNNAVINNIFCYISSARHSIADDNIIAACEFFYKHDDVISAKKILYTFSKENLTERRCENKCNQDIKNMLNLFRVLDEEKMNFLSFLCDGY